MASEVVFADIERAVEQHDPLLAELVVRYLNQPDPPEDRPEGADDDARVELPEGTWTMARARQALSPSSLLDKTPAERKNLRREVFAGLLAAPHAPPRLRLGALLERLYDEGDALHRVALMKIFSKARLGWGSWQAYKSVLKKAEDGHDAAMFGVLAARLDIMSRTETTREIGRGTFVYLRRRAWRYLRQLGKALPELYPLFACEVLRNYPADERFNGSWIAAQIWNHEGLKGEGRPGYYSSPPKKLSRRAYNKAWKLSPRPLMQLLLDADNDTVCDFAIRSLEADFPEQLRQVDVSWLKRLAERPSGRVHELLVKLLGDNPELHQSKLRERGLHDAVLRLLLSSSAAARKYAIGYATAHAPDLSIERLMELALSDITDAEKFAAERLEKQKGSDIGIERLIQLVNVSATAKLAQKKLQAGWSSSDLTQAQFVALFMESGGPRSFVRKWFKADKRDIPGRFLAAALDHPDYPYWERHTVLQELGKRKPEDIGIDWIKQALLGDDSYTVAGWLRGGMLQGKSLDLDWMKGLVAMPQQRSVALTVLGNKKWVKPQQLGLGWLLSMARQPEQELSQFAQRYLLENFAPADFAAASSGDAEARGMERLWQLALGKGEPEPVRQFAHTYLRVHHPDLNKQTPQAKQLGVKPRLKHAAFSLDRVRPLLFDERADVQKLASAIARHEIKRWGDAELLYELAGHRLLTPRRLGHKLLLGIGDDDADPQLPLKWLDAAKVYALAESPKKATREVALSLIRRHHQALGGAARLAWLMESPDREVRLFAVRLLWQQHQPAPGADWKPGRVPDDARAAADAKPSDAKSSDGDKQVDGAKKVAAKKASGSAPEGGERFESAEALQSFLRAILFGLPPGRLERRDAGDAMVDRGLSASIGKRRLLEVVTELAVADEAFAQLVTPVLSAFMHSRARMEREACIAALARVRVAHPSVEVPLPPAIVPPLQAPKRRHFAT